MVWLCTYSYVIGGILIVAVIRLQFCVVLGFKGGWMRWLP